MKRHFQSMIAIIGLTASLLGYSQTGNDVWNPDAIYNLDLVSYTETLDAYIVEVNNSESSRVDAILEYDLERIKSYQAKLRSTIDDIWNTPRADMPHSTGNIYDISYSSEFLDFGETSNEGIRYVMRWWANMMVQTTRSDSASGTNGINQFDYARQIQALDKLDAYLNSYEADGAPVDKPQNTAFERAQRAGNQ